ncbi:MAG: TfoX/Sxy family protein [Hyphomonadaceae bacterium]|nr:TfoX/Sxy family protein [Hyphomonadaceae bacterium]
MSGFSDFVSELLAGLGPEFGPIRVKRMFGGAGVYVGELPMFGLIADDVLYLKIDEALKAELARAGSGPFVWTPARGPKAGEAIDLGYWRLPEEALEEPELACLWARKAIGVAVAKALKRKKQKREE